MAIDKPNISTEYQPKGSGRNPSDTLDRPVGSEDKVAPKTSGTPKAPSDPVIDEKGRPLNGDGTLADTAD